MAKFQSMTTFNLRRVCRLKRWKGYSRFNKASLIRYMYVLQRRETRAAVTIQRWWRRCCEVVNKTDVFTLEPFPKYIPIFKLKEGGRTYQFNVKTLMEYMFSSGKFWNPYTRKLLSAKQLQQLKEIYFANFSRETKITYNRGQTPLRPDANMHLVSQAVRLEKQEDKQAMESMEFLIEESNVLFDNLMQLIDGLDAQNIGFYSAIIMDDIVPQITNNFVHMFGIQARPTIRYVTQLHTGIAKLLHHYNDYYRHNVLIDLEVWLRSHLHLQTQRQ
uniref:Uncharacterized protein n=1 Tax=viral metagenome TaxID=1070528 RepID=A0A6C0BQX2_9ZZZZ